jgi:solute carrier family 25 oxoglutarate transporter 11
MKNQWIGINPNKVFREIHETGVGLRGFYYGIEAALLSRVGYLFLRNFL